MLEHLRGTLRVTNPVPEEPGRSRKRVLSRERRLLRAKRRQRCKHCVVSPESNLRGEPSSLSMRGPCQALAYSVPVSVPRLAGVGEHGDDRTGSPGT